jgi:hypothetical protein
MAWGDRQVMKTLREIIVHGSASDVRTRVRFLTVRSGGDR